MEQELRQENLWSLSFLELARRCQQIAEEISPAIDSLLRAEAKRLCAGWQEALQKPGRRIDDRAQRENQLASLRKRTIEILVSIDRSQ